jgi:hypothetical protein
VGVHVASILENGFIKPATNGVPANEKPAVWFSTVPHWEPTANKMWIRGGRMYRLDQEETAARGQGLFRIEVSPGAASHTWAAWKKLSGVAPADAAALSKAAHKMGSDPQRWRVSFDSVEKKLWLGIQRWNGRTWEQYPENNLTALRGSNTGAMAQDSK